ncbi:hypothetical protein HOG17_00795 [Candidatus Peregrinibacteria bacterium]|nr:hypothetical protein [Candidatus Peregrinibacteria bacterium]MBT4148610.1 hypothetical protein [Candidatus Peregrinibacteria bacterium]MBT4455773.1 hypothetical protein [Candidatus Peregrinibacteria bacterium]
MIISCLKCGKSVSSHQMDCPYCKAVICDYTRQANGLKANMRPKEGLRLNFLQTFAKR